MTTTTPQRAGSCADLSGATARPWQEAAENICTAVEKRFAQSIDVLYDHLLQTTQDYLRENVYYNLSAQLESLEASNRELREKAATTKALLAECDAENARLREALLKDQQTFGSLSAALSDDDPLVRESRLLANRAKKRLDAALKSQPEAV